ncbi:uncharacterized protein LOC110095215 [Dendrobium catenatum]|uniref:uncharacterized protein LOC110095215 n=1 Tax=Dendrobium catenatum TaxID=906689 RepID=UPI0009F742BE|nr:uncharacterized protein LOC110095215 [Dendrobium catenatum]
MASEFLALQQQGTWTLVPAPPNQMILGSRWTYKIKTNPNGTIAHYKARLVAQGHRQEYGLNYTETFSPVAKFPSLRVFLTVAFNNHWPLHQLDVTNAFLHGSLNEQIFMKQPTGFENNQLPNHVCFSKNRFMVSNKLPANDDILFTGNDSKHLLNVMSAISNNISIRNLEKSSRFIGIEIAHNGNHMFLTQTQYTQAILQQVGLIHCKPLANPSLTKLPVNCPALPNFFDPVNCPALPNFFDPISYRHLKGSLQYLTITRPDISFAVNALSQHLHNPQPLHFSLLKRLLRYLKGTSQFGIPILKSNLTLCTFSDADWATDPLTRRSISGYFSFLGDTLISWTVKKQTTVARSSTDTEYRSLAAATSDAIWLRRLLSDFQTHQTEPTEIHCDNMSAIALANNPVFHSRTKHIEVYVHFI